MNLYNEHQCNNDEQYQNNFLKCFMIYFFIDKTAGYYTKQCGWKDSNKKIYFITNEEYTINEVQEDFLNLMLEVGLVFKDKKSKNKYYYW